MPEASVPAAFERWERPAPPIGRRDIGLSVVVSTTGDNAGTAHAAIVTPDTHRATTINWPGHPDQIRERAAVAALALAYRVLRPGGREG